MEDKINVFLIDDENIFLVALETLLLQEGSFQVIQKATSGEAVLNEVKYLSAILEADVITLDIRMPGKGKQVGINGIEVAKSLKEQFPHTKILILSSYSKIEFIKTLLLIGIEGYLVKGADEDDLIDALKSIASGDTFFGKEVSKTIALSQKRMLAYTHPESIVITKREKQIIELIAEGLTTQEIADNIHLAVNTINTHRKRIREKTGAKNAIGILRFGLRTGIVKDFDLY